MFLPPLSHAYTYLMVENSPQPFGVEIRVKSNTMLLRFTLLFLEQYWLSNPSDLYLWFPCGYIPGYSVVLSNLTLVTRRTPNPSSPHSYWTSTHMVSAPAKQSPRKKGAVLYASHHYHTFLLRIHQKFSWEKLTHFKVLPHNVCCGPWRVQNAERCIHHSHLKHDILFTMYHSPAKFHSNDFVAVMIAKSP